MSILSRLQAMRSPDAACARALFAGQPLPPGAPASQEALARLLEVAAAPGTARELTGEVAAAAAFVQVTSQHKPRRSARRVLAVAACVLAVGGTAVYASVMPSPPHKMVPLPFGVPATHHIAPAQVFTRVPPRPPDRRQARPEGQAAGRKARQAVNPAGPLRSGGR